MDGWTSVDPKVGRNYERVCQNIYGIYDQLDKFFGVFFDNLYIFWYSPIAVEFDEENREKCNEVLQLVKNYGKDFIKDVGAALATMSDSLGSETSNYIKLTSENYIQKYENRFNHLENSLKLQEEKGDDVGMEMNGIESIIKDLESQSTIQTILEDAKNGESIESVELGVHDPSNDIEGAYKRKAQEMTNKVAEIIHEIIENLHDSIEEEKEEAELAKDMAADLMKSDPGPGSFTEMMNHR